MDEARQRSRLLSARDEFIQRLAGEAKSRLASVAGSNHEAYNKLIKDLVAQSVARLDGEKAVEIHCRPQDLAVAQKAVSAVAQDLKSKGRTVTVTATADAALGGSAGGVVAWAQGGRIKCNNTLEDRLGLVMGDLTPVIRDLLFPSARAEVRTKPPVNFPHHAGSAPAPPPAPKPVAAPAPKPASNAGGTDPFAAF
jgi:V-type H+-transporting ATPase subunit E